MTVINEDTIEQNLIALLQMATLMCKAVNLMSHLYSKNPFFSFRSAGCR